VVLLAPHAARKTTSGKIARQWNLRAFRGLVAPAGGAATPAAAPPSGSGGDAASASSPWTRTGRGANVLHLWLAPSASAVEAEEAGLAEGSGAGEAGAGAAVGPAGASAPQPPPSSPGDPERMALTGAALSARLLAEVAALLKDGALGRADCSLALGDLGMDSLLLAQLAGLLTHEYGFAQLRDEMLFGEYCSVDGLVAHAPELRGAVPLAPAALLPLAGARRVERPAAGAAAAGVDAAGGTAGAGSGATAAGAPGGMQPLELEAGTGGVAEVGLVGGHHHRRQAKAPKKVSWFEANCPCCLFCC
jgi:hypothetical protein